MMLLVDVLGVGLCCWCWLMMLLVYVVVGGVAIVVVVVRAEHVKVKQEKVSICLGKSYEGFTRVFRRANSWTVISN